MLKKFTIEGDGKVRDVGLRPNLVAQAQQFNLKICPQNIGGNKVEIIIEGSDEDINKFHNYIEEEDARAIKENGYKVTKPEIIDKVPDFGYCLNALNLEQTVKIVERAKYLKSIDGKLDSLPVKIAIALKHS